MAAWVVAIAVAARRKSQGCPSEADEIRAHDALGHQARPPIDRDDITKARRETARTRQHSNGVAPIAMTFRVTAG
jgi:hypothetical protein